jgi:hypothetical protein
MSEAPHDLLPFPHRSTAEARMLYCRRCGATQPIEATARPPLGPCPLAPVAEPTTPRSGITDVRGLIATLYTDP